MTRHLIHSPGISPWVCQLQHAMHEDTIHCIIKQKGGGGGGGGGTWLATPSLSSHTHLLNDNPTFN